ncbi:MAG TPA: VCBS repeat-containing protein [Gemmatimonadaceae bacterium]|nr:VCBS repeat-containing protein [Gemmatimonadaceae bacterium]
MAFAVRRLLFLSCCFVAASCSRERATDDGPRDAAPPPVGTTLFTRLPATYTGVSFGNRLVESREHNVFTYRNFYNGGGVAIGDLTGDSLPEVVLTSNQDGPRVYLNLGSFRFRDITKASGLETEKGSWTTGVVLADVNGDGRLDIYLCRAGSGDPQSRANQLWINQGNASDGTPRFKEMASEYGVADPGYSTQAAFFDYDHDGDLDLFIINNSPRPVSSFDNRNVRNVRHPYGGHKLYRNDNGKFTDVSAQAGIFGSEVGFGLGLAVADVNHDGWPDIYVSNDFFERDYLYINNRDGSFVESLEKAMPYSSYFSMGLDVADIDNDGWPDIYTTDMLPDDEARLKTTSSFDSWEVYQAKVRTGYGRQFMRNMLQHNNGDASLHPRQTPTFSDIGQLAGVSRTDWSWSALIADLDLDGNKDIFVTNGLLRDVTSQDYIAFLADARTMGSARAAGAGKVDFMKLIGAMTSTKLANFAFRNHGDSSTGLGAGWSFSNEAKAWGLDTPTFASGAAYGDLDGDGAPDLVVNNVNDPVFIYRNNARTLDKENHYLQVRLDGEGKNRFAVGARVTLYGGSEQFVQELAPTRGFQSSVDYVLTFGVGPCLTLDSLIVEWPDGRETVLNGVATNKRVLIRQAEAAAGNREQGTGNRALTSRSRLLEDVTDLTGISWIHRENQFVDFDRERLMPRMVSTEGPALAVGDVNGDGLDDIYFGGAKGQPGALYIQQADGRFTPSNTGVFAADSASEDVAAVFFDANGDKHPDLYVVSGGNEFSELASALQDRLYLNDGHGQFHKAEGSLPTDGISGSHVLAEDYDGDGDIDLFVGGRVVPWKYGANPQSMLLQNDGRGHFTDATPRLAPELARVGMVTDAVWSDVDGDGRKDLVVVGEWMPITIFHNAGGGRLTPMVASGLEHSAGWWNRIVAGDFTGDGKVDFIVGNAGLNSRCHASATEPVTMYVKDFGQTGYAEQIVSCFNHGVSYPLVVRDELLKTVPKLASRYPTHKAYATQTVADMFSQSELADAIFKSAETFATSLVRNDGGGKFTLIPLPREAQLAPVYGIFPHDVDGDGVTDLALGGNLDEVRTDIGAMHASYGLVLKGDGRGTFEPIPVTKSGFFVPGQTRDIQRVRTRNGALYVVARNNDRPLVFRGAPGR